MLRESICRWMLLALWLTATHELAAQPPAAETEHETAVAPIRGTIPSAIGVTRKGIAIAVTIGAGDLDYDTPKTRLLLVGGLDGKHASVNATQNALRWFHESNAAADWRKKFSVSAVPCANPDGLAAGMEGNASGGNPLGGYPPKGSAYDSPTDPEAAYLWRWTGMHAPDLVLEVRHGKRLMWHRLATAGDELAALGERLEPADVNVADDELAPQLFKTAACETGIVPALRVDVASGDVNPLPALFAAMERSKFPQPSPARREIQQRLDRSPREVAEQLTKHYGHELGQVVYIPALAMVARIRLGELTGDEQHLADVERIVEPYYSGKKETKPTNGSALSGHLIFCELARVTKGERRARYLELANEAARLCLDEAGHVRPSMPYHSEMSDALFMGGPILARVGVMRDKPRYLEACARHIAFMRKLVLRDDGLYRHSPLDEAAWGRGNGFPALGLAMILSDFPENHPDRAELLEAYRAHMRTLVKYQDPNGCWHQVVDHPESYRELTSTCMITYALVRGVRRGWLSRDEFAPVIDRAWYAIRTRAPADGRLVDVCTGTGKQRNLRAYYDRPAILGPDGRGGAMALMAAVELAAADWKSKNWKEIAAEDKIKD